MLDSALCLANVPMKALAMVILSHILSRTSRPDSGQAMAFATVAMSLWIERWKSSNPGGYHKTHLKLTQELNHILLSELKHSSQISLNTSIKTVQLHSVFSPKSLN